MDDSFARQTWQPRQAMCSVMGMAMHMHHEHAPTSHTMHSLTHLPFDRILGHSSTNPASVVYADITSPSFRSFHQTVSMTARSGKTSYRVRYKPSTTLHQHLSVSGYGIELALKRTDYIVIDDRQADDHVSADITTAQATLQDNQVADLRPLPESLLRKLDIKAASFVMNSETPLETLLKLSQDFPKHSAAIAATNASQHFLNEHAANREIFLPPGYNVVWINGVQILPRDFDAFSMLEHLRRERRLINSAKDLGLTSQDAINLLSHPAISAASDDQEPQRYDFRDENEGGHVIMWLNDIEKDKRYNEWPDNIRAVSEVVELPACDAYRRFVAAATHVSWTVALCAQGHSQPRPASRLFIL